MEQTEKTIEGLLEILAYRLDCVYLSDLRQSWFLPAIQREISKISPKKFSLREWQDAVTYITEDRRPFESPEQAADYLKNYRI